MERLERFFLIVAGILLVGFLAAVGYAAVGMHIHLPGHGSQIHYTSEQGLLKVVRHTPPFDRPGLRQVAPGKYEAVFIARTWSFVPDKIEVPRGSEVTFIATSGDVVHGFYIAGTRVNMMLLPGEVSRMTYRFDHPGNYLLLCHEYCGHLHETMSGEVKVQ